MEGRKCPGANPTRGEVRRRPLLARAQGWTEVRLITSREGPACTVGLHLFSNLVAKRKRRGQRLQIEHAPVTIQTEASKEDSNALTVPQAPGKSEVTWPMRACLTAPTRSKTSLDSQEGAQRHNMAQTNRSPSPVGEDSLPLSQLTSIAEWDI